ncbi:MAG: radical SAM protein [Chitinophagaceae bacterium]
MIFKLSKYLHIVNDKSLLGDYCILYSTRSGAVLQIINKHLDAIKIGRYEDVPYSILRKLIEKKIIVNNNEDELISILNFNKAAILEDDTLSYTVQPTSNCQLGCRYCGQVHSKNVMSSKVADAVIARISNLINIKKDKIRHLGITWYGGEPLTGLDALEYCSDSLQKISEKNGISYSASMITNGLSLKYDLFKKLVTKHKISSFQITLDGTKEFHDRRRMLKNGQESFDIIFANIKKIVLSDFFEEANANITIRSNVDSENKDNILELMDLLKVNGLHNKINFAIAPIFNWGDNNASKANPIDKNTFAKFEIDVMLKQIHDGFLINKGVVPQRQKTVCMVVAPNSEVFDGFGNVSTCWEVPYTPFYENKGFVAGNVFTNPSVSTKNTLMRNWYDEVPKNDSWCKDCKFLPVCGGGCPKSWYMGEPACPSFKFNIEDRILIEKFNLIR